MDWVHAAVLICCCLLTFGSYFSYDLPGALTDDFREVLAQNETSKQGLFYSFYSLPNTVQPFFGGILVDKLLGLRLGATICCTLVAVGCTIVAVAASISSIEGTSSAFLLTLAGRLCFGLGGETLSVCQNAMCAKWFRGSDLATAFAIVLSFARVGSAVNFAIEPKISDEYGFAAALWLSAFFCLMSVGACLVLWYFDAKYEHTLDEEEEEGGEEEEDGTDHNIEVEVGQLENPLEQRLLDQTNRQTRSNSAGQLGDVEELPLPTPPLPRTPKRESSSTFAVLMSVLGTREILIYLICVQFYIAVFIFIAVASKLLVDEYDDIDKIKAGLLVSLPYTVSAIVSPILGLLMDRIGRGVLFVGIACASLVGVHVVFAFFPQSVNPMFVMIWLGFTYSTCAASLWPMIALVVESRNISTAYGLMMSIQNIGLALAPIFIMGMIPDYKGIESIFAGFGCGALFCTVVLYFVDQAQGGILSAKPTDDVILATRPSPRVNPLRPSPSPFIAAAGARIRVDDEARRTAIGPKTPQMIRRQYFRKLRIQSHI